MLAVVGHLETANEARWTPPLKKWFEGKLRLVRWSPSGEKPSKFFQGRN
jgi:hypothetical protein